mmetsp:Transcript_1888/g.2647  ORF Transcript_1888/g.2647 Transcript_1888/m.2647 type:complete len:192 (+) Transcript_1888:169-744(+)
MLANGVARVCALKAHVTETRSRAKVPVGLGSKATETIQFGRKRYPMIATYAKPPSEREGEAPSGSSPQDQPKPTTSKSLDEDEEVSIGEAFKAGQEVGDQIKSEVYSRFSRPVIDDVGLPAADATVCIGGSVLLALVILATGVPRPTWLVPAPWVPRWRSLQFLAPAVQHGSALALCWVLGANGLPFIGQD